MTRRARSLGVLAACLLLVGGVLLVQILQGGGRFEPLRPADPCGPRDVTSRSAGLDGLTERLVLLGLDDAACRLSVSRESLTLELGRTGEPTDAQVDALRAGLRSAIGRMNDEGALPPASALVDEALGATDLNRFLKTAIRALPDAVIDSALRTDDVLLRTVDDLDLRTLLANLEDPSDIDEQIEIAVTRAVREAIGARLRSLL